MRSIVASTFLSLSLIACPLSAQEIVTTPIDQIPLDELIGQLTTVPNEEEEELLTTVTEAVTLQVATATSGELRVLDKLTGYVTDLTLGTGETASLGFLTVTMNECRYPVENPSGDAFTEILVRDTRETTPLFSGWMLASSPALNAMDHPRYDVWALRCITS
ncbi:uncharacterized protein DUF2155 [Loktanella sp. PT4BL]|jgi:hypothetical protein|uniref:DUF2155 domain-containing protein n=1 Tax=Loktanella sp. PT4BL TaxID=2135611 RepID=UPI000D772211|nr:DUF2155 domain-containing protein [Loktanella sp. PT4BL]PXW69216.1 uncharacterized protein DUF2155 [Loktanella sp. PT4BL]